MTINTLIAELRAGLEGTTPGEWGRNDTDDYAEIIAHDLTRPVALVGRADDADHVCRCSPDNVRALLDHIERLTDPRQIVGGGYVQLSDYDAMQARAEAAEAELARLRAPVTDGEVGDCLAKLNNRKVNEPDFGMRLRHETADLLQRLAGQVAEANRVDALSIDTIMTMNRQIVAAEDRLREAVEVSVPRDDAIGVVAALAATISIIERTPQARKAAMSDKAFGMMLADYTKALAKGRAMLSASGGNRD